MQRLIEIMITLQNIGISWKKAARGGKLATVRNAVPHAFEISFEREYQNLENCISVRYESIQIEDNATHKLISEVGNLIFEVENEELLIKIPKYNGYNKQLATLQNRESVRFIRFYKSMDYDHNTTYYKEIVNLVFSNESIPHDFFITQSFKHQFDEKSGIWYM